MMVSIGKPNYILQLCQECFYSELRITLECKDIKLFAQFFVHHINTMSLTKGLVVCEAPCDHFLNLNLVWIRITRVIVLV
jgi:hypothetical protein